MDKLWLSSFCVVIKFPKFLIFKQSLKLLTEPYWFPSIRFVSNRRRITITPFTSALWLSRFTFQHHVFLQHYCFYQQVSGSASMHKSVILRYDKVIGYLYFPTGSFKTVYLSWQFSRVIVIGLLEFNEL